MPANMIWISLLLVTVFCLNSVLSHGMMLQPASRSSLWRFKKNAKINYDDNAYNCGGLNVQFNNNGGRCGLCGDSYDAPHPQDNENTGKYGEGIIAATYPAGSVIDINITLTANHKGSFNYSLCVLEDPSLPEPGEECFIPLKLENGNTKSLVDADINGYVDKVQLPSDITCKRCVFRWTYRGGNNWGYCDNGTGGLGCGPQEHFRNCADISIV